MTQDTVVEVHQKITRIAKKLRIGVWLFFAVILSAFIASFFTEHAGVAVKSEFVNEELYLALVDNGLYPENLYGVIQDISLLMVVVFLFWLQRLLGFFQINDYFSNQSIRCYLWMAWLFVIMIIMPVFQKFYLQYLAYRYLPDIDIDFSVDIHLSSIVLLILLPLIIYLLRVAQSIEHENQEFV